MVEQTTEDIKTPTSSPPTSPQQILTPFLTPLSIQVHPSTLQALQINSVSPHLPSGVYPASLLQPAGLGSTFASMAPASQTANMNRSKPAGKSQKKRKSQSSSTQKATTSKISKGKSPLTGNQKKNCKNNNPDEPLNETVDPPSTRKAPVRWEDDKNDQGESAMSLFLKWITTYGNWARYKDRNFVKKMTVEGLIDYLADNGIARRKVNTVMDKISNLKQSFHNASNWLNGTGQGVMLDLEAEKVQNSWYDNHPEYLACQKSRIEDYVRKYHCKYYYELEPVMGTCDKSTRILSANSVKQSHPDESLECLGLTTKDTINSQVDENNSQVLDEEYDKEDDDDNDSDIPNESQAQKRAPRSSRENHLISSQSQNSTPGPSQPGKRRKPGAESQIKQLICEKDSEVRSSFSKIEDVILETKRDHMDSQLQACKLQAAKLELQKTKQSMQIELADARGKFIAQMMSDKNWTFEQAKEVACGIYKTPEPIPDDILDMSFKCSQSQ
ncbi:hypothetical protein DFH28DRAFT_962987 [Melampsora americana]|nr:hypothetical protein DFH28DRAFT_962987 [Melampsora americana]